MFDYWLYDKVLVLVGDISGRGSLLGLIGFFCELVCLFRLLLFILAEPVQHFLDKLHCYHFASLLGIRIRDTLVKYAFLESTHLVVELKLLFFQFFQKFFALHLFSLKLVIFLTFLVLMAYTIETAA